MSELNPDNFNVKFIKETFENLVKARRSLGSESVDSRFIFFDKRYNDVEYVISLKVRPKKNEDE